jgi:hypothetical protein
MNNSSFGMCAMQINHLIDGLDSLTDGAQLALLLLAGHRNVSAPWAVESII